MVHPAICYLYVFLRLSLREVCLRFDVQVFGPPLNKKSFPVDRPGGIILRLYPAAYFFYFFFKLKYFSHFLSDF